MTKLNDKTIGIFGATGTIGSALVKALSNQNVPLCAFVRDLNKAQQIKAQNVEIRYLDFSKPDKQVLKNIYKLFWMPSEYIANEATWIEFAKINAVAHIVKLSSIHPEVFHLRTSEILVEKSGIPFTHLRPNTFMQNFNTQEKETIVNEQAFYFPAGMGKTSFIDIRDIAEIAAKILLGDSHENKIYTLTGSETLDCYQTAEILSKVCGKLIRYVDTSTHPEFESEIKRENKMRQDFFAGVRRGLFATIYPDLEELLGHKAITFQQYAQDYWGIT